MKVVLTTVFDLQVDAIKIASNEEMSNIKVVHLVETRNFDFWIMSIQGHMRLLWPK